MEITAPLCRHEREVVSCLTPYARIWGEKIPIFTMADISSSANKPIGAADSGSSHLGQRFNSAYCAVGNGSKGGITDKSLDLSTWQMWGPH